MYSFIVLYPLIINVSFGLKIEINCPQICKCDKYEGLRRATCHNRKLVTLEADIPKEVEILDMSFNQISHLENEIFAELGYTEMKLLNLSNNKVSQIHMNAFHNLKVLKSVDLSHNYLQYVLTNWFWYTESLQELYLSHNSFLTFGEPRIQSQTLKKLDVSYCHIQEIVPNAFSKLPSLETLDVSGNYLLQINVALAKPLENLQIFKLENNTLACNNATKQLSVYCKKRGIKCSGICVASSKQPAEEKFQRMVNIELVQEKNSWIYDDEENKTVVIQTKEVCSNTTSTSRNLLEEIVHISPFFFLLAPFIFGLALGLLLGCKINISTRSFFNSHGFRQQIVRSSSFQYSTPLIENGCEMPDSTPMVQRRILNRA